MSSKTSSSRRWKIDTLGRHLEDVLENKKCLLGNKFISMKITCNQNSCRPLFLYLIPFYFQKISQKTSAFHQFFVFVFLPYILCATRFSLWSRFFADSVLSWRYDTKVLINYMTNVSLYLVVSDFEPLPPALHQFVIPAPILIPVLIWNPSCSYLKSLCPDLLSLLPWFVIHKIFPTFSFFPFLVLEFEHE